MNRIDNQFTMPKPLGSINRSNEQNFVKDTDNHKKANADDLSLNSMKLNHNAAISMKLVFQSVSSNFLSSTSSSNDSPLSRLASAMEAPEKAASDIFDFEKVAEEVMSFISTSMMAAKDRGATEEELQEMLKQGRAGANLGLDQAIGELDDMAMLDDELTVGIEKSRDLINEGIDELTKKLFPNDNQVSSPNGSIVDSPTANSTRVENESYSSNTKSSDLTITTTDGDIVSISFSDIQEYASSSNYNINEKDGSTNEDYNTSYAAYREVNFSYSVEGDLDDEERSAIETLIKEVNSLQKDFFSGDVEKAYEKALELGFDNQQISGFSMDLQQTQKSYVSQTYTEVASFDENLIPKANKELKPLIDFVEQFKALQEKTDQIFSKDDDTLGQLLTAVLKAEYGDIKEPQKALIAIADKLK
jgi:hypothetical protein